MTSGSVRQHLANTCLGGSCPFSSTTCSACRDQAPCPPDSLTYVSHSLLRRGLDALPKCICAVQTSICLCFCACVTQGCGRNTILPFQVACTGNPVPSHLCRRIVYSGPRADAVGWLHDLGFEAPALPEDVPCFLTGCLTPQGAVCPTAAAALRYPAGCTHHTRPLETWFALFLESLYV